MLGWCLTIAAFSHLFSGKKCVCLLFSIKNNHSFTNRNAYRNSSSYSPHYALSKKGWKAAESFNELFSKGTISESQVESWFKKFKTAETNLEHGEGRGRPSEFTTGPSSGRGRRRKPDNTTTTSLWFQRQPVVDRPLFQEARAAVGFGWMGSPGTLRRQQNRTCTRFCWFDAIKWAHSVSEESSHGYSQS